MYIKYTHHIRWKFLDKAVHIILDLKFQFSYALDVYTNKTLKYNQPLGGPIWDLLQVLSVVRLTLSQFLLSIHLKDLKSVGGGAYSSVSKVNLNL